MAKINSGVFSSSRCFWFTLAPHWRGVILPSSPIPTGRWNPCFVLGESVIPTPQLKSPFQPKKKNQTRQLLVIHKRGGRQPEVLLPKVNSIQSIPCQFLNCIHFENILATLLSHNPPMPEKNSKARNSRDFFGRVQSPKPKMMNAWIMLNHMMQMNMSPEIRITTVLPGIWGTCIIFNEWIARHKKLV